MTRSRSLLDRVVDGYFRLWAPTYDWSPLQLLLYHPVHRAVVRAIQRLPGPPARVLDLGCGTAQLTEELRRGIPSATVAGLDVSAGMLAAARARFGATGPALVRGDAYALPFATGSLDLVTSTIAYHWLIDARAALAEMHRVLGPGGHLVLGTLVARLIPGIWFAMRLQTEGGHRRELTRAGFGVERIDRVGLRTVVITARAG